MSWVTAGSYQHCSLLTRFPYEWMCIGRHPERIGWVQHSRRKFLTPTWEEKDAMPDVPFLVYVLVFDVFSSCEMVCVN